MSKRRRKDLLLKTSQGNESEDVYKTEDYTADFESYDFENKNVAEIDEHREQAIRPSVSQYSVDSAKSNFSNAVECSEDVENENLCRDYVRNVCRRGRACKFKHPITTQTTWINKIETKVTGNQFEVNFCHDYQNNGCNRPQCRFIHCNRPEQEFYYATGILLSSVPCNNMQVPFCKDFLNGACARLKCKYLHMTKEEIEQQGNRVEIKTNQPTDFPSFNIEQSAIQPNGNFFPNTNANFYPSTQQVSVLPSQSISLGSSLSVTNAQFTVSLPLGSVSYSTSQQQLIAQPSLTNLQYIHDPILSSVAHEVGPLNSDLLTQIPASNIVSQIHPQQQVVYSGIIHNNAVSLPQHHTLQPQFTLISSDNQSHSQLISAPLPVGSSNTTGHIISPVAVAHANQSQSQQYTISQQPPVGVSIFSVATPCSLLSASSTTADVMQTFQQQQLRPFDQKDQTCLLQSNLKTTGNLEFSVNDKSHIKSTLTPIYIQHSLPSAVPVTQYRVTALESTATPGIVIHNSLDHNNVTLVHTTPSSANQLGKNANAVDDKVVIKTLSSRKLSDKYFHIVEENEKLKKKLLELQKQTSDLQTANELLLEQNARLRNSKSYCNVSASGVSPESNSVDSMDSDSNIGPLKKHSNRYSSSNNQSSLPKQNDSVANTMSEIATITLTVPIGKPHITQSMEHSLTPVLSAPYSVDGAQKSMTEISYSVSSNSPESGLENVLSTSVCSEYLSPTLVTSAIRSIQKSVMPTLHALVASSNVMNSVDCSIKQNRESGGKNCKMTPELCVSGGLEVEVPARSSSCPVTCSYAPAPDSAPKCHELSGRKGCCFRQNDFCHTPQLCFQ